MGSAWAAQKVQVVSGRAIIYADASLRKAVGYLRKGKTLSVTNKKFGGGRAHALMVKGKVRYIKVSDVRSVGAVAPARIGRRRSVKKSSDDDLSLDDDKPSSSKLENPYKVSAYFGRNTTNLSFDQDLQPGDGMIWGGFSAKFHWRTSEKFEWRFGFSNFSYKATSELGGTPQEQEISYLALFGEAAYTMGKL